MYTYIGIEDLVANALIELMENSQKKEVLFSTLNQYGATVVQILLEQGRKAVLILSNKEKHDFLFDYSEMFELFSNGTEEGIRLKSNVTLDDLWNKFRGNMSIELIEAFSNKASMAVLGIK